MSVSSSAETVCYGWKPASLAAIRPDGWLLAFLQRQRDGLTGHLQVAGYPFNTTGWLNDHIPLGERGGTGWWPFEQYAYWVDGCIRCGILLDDVALKDQARTQLDHVLAHPDPDGYLGPAALKQLVSPRCSERWPHAVFFRALMADYDERPDRATLDAVRDHYLNSSTPHDNVRNVCNVEIMAWLFEQTGDERMRECAIDSYTRFQRTASKSGATLRAMSSDERADDHGPTYMELFKLGAVLYRITGNRRYLRATENAQRKLVRDHVLVDGVPSATEHMRGIYSTAGHETCVISDYLWSLGVLLAATGRAAHADAMERVAFNALPGAVTSDVRALQYFSGPNQVVAGAQTNHHPHGRGSTHISYRPNPATECCPSNLNRALPAYIGRMWMEDPRGGIIAALYGPSRYETVLQGGRVSVIEETDYPFSETITFRLTTERPTSFRFTLRIPGWCEEATIRINGRRVRRRLRPGTFVVFDRTYCDGDVIEAYFPMSIRCLPGPEDGVSIHYGPLVMALPVCEQRRRERKDKRSSSSFPAWSMTPKSKWNYGIPLDRASALPAVALKRWPMTRDPWEPESAPIRITIAAHRIPDWRLIRKQCLRRKWGNKVHVIEGDLQFVPALPTPAARARAGKRVHEIDLVPYGFTCLRIAWFPRLPSIVNE